jgi:hypothetical protein
VKTTAELVDHWIVNFGSVYNAEFDAAVLAIWHQLFDGFDPEQFHKACVATLLEHKFQRLPFPAEVIERIERAVAAQQESNADAEWKIVDQASRYYDPEFKDWQRAPYNFVVPALSPPADFALRACGGYDALATADSKHRGLIRKQFTENYLKYRKLPPPNVPSAVRKLLDGKTGTEEKQIGPGPEQQVAVQRGRGARSPGVGPAR